MLIRRTTTQGLVFYASPLLEESAVPHAFSTRVGGISPAPFDSLNLGNPNGCDIQDDYERIWDNYRLLQEAAGCGKRELCRVHQVHGATVALAVKGRPFDVAQKADSIVTDDPSRVVSVRVADCVPVLLSGAGGSVVAAVHAGWRGVVAGVVPQTLRAMQGLAQMPADSVLAAIGPSIGPDAFEVGQEVVAQFTAVFGAAAPVRSSGHGKSMLDLRQALRVQLLQFGIRDESIDTTDLCTFRDRDEFFSHRRDQGVTGRMAAIISTTCGGVNGLFPIVDNRKETLHAAGVENLQKTL